MSILYQLTSFYRNIKIKIFLCAVFVLLCTTNNLFGQWTNELIISDLDLEITKVSYLDVINDKKWGGIPFTIKPKEKGRKIILIKLEAPIPFGKERIAFCPEDFSLLKYIDGNYRPIVASAVKVENDWVLSHEGILISEHRILNKNKIVIYVAFDNMLIDGSSFFVRYPKYATGKVILE